MQKSVTLFCLMLPLAAAADMKSSEENFPSFQGVVFLTSSDRQFDPDEEFQGFGEVAFAESVNKVKLDSDDIVCIADALLFDDLMDKEDPKLPKSKENPKIYRLSIQEQIAFADVLNAEALPEVVIAADDFILKDEKISEDGQKKKTSSIEFSQNDQTKEEELVAISSESIQTIEHAADQKQKPQKSLQDIFVETYERFITLLKSYKAILEGK